MIVKIRQWLPGTGAPQRPLFLDRVLLWSALVLVLSVVGFAAYYLIDREVSTAPSATGPSINLEQYEQVVRDDPNNIANRIALADAYFGLGRYLEAAHQYEAALVINDKSALARLGLGRSQVAVADHSGASQNLQAVIDQSKEEDISGTLVQSAHYYLGKMALDQMEFDQAIAELTEATALERTDADAWYLMGTAYIQKGDLEEAISALTRAVMFVPNFTEAYEQLALAYDQQGAAAQALYARGMAAYSIGQFDDAAEQLEAATGKSATFAQAYAGLGLVREAQGQRDAAIIAYEQALHLNPDDFTAKGGLARLSGASGVSPEGLPADHPSTGQDTESNGGGTQ
jgi:tetratricopeptide (TPR) repeat protein